MIIDTAGLDDESELSESRKKKTLEVLSKTNVALVVIDSTIGVTENDTAITKEEINNVEKEIDVPVSALNKSGIEELKQKIIGLIPDD